jgi:hypothetical protein
LIESSAGLIRLNRPEPGDLSPRFHAIPRFPRSDDYNNFDLRDLPLDELRSLLGDEQ